MKSKLNFKRRRSIRLPGYDYSQPGAYFVTMVTQGRELLFGEVIGGEMRLNDYGRIADEAWRWLATQYPYVELDDWVIMPNHVHGIIMIHDGVGRGGSRPAPTDVPMPPPSDGPTSAPTDVPMPPPSDGPTFAPTDVPMPAPTIKPLGQLIGAFKTVSAKQINLARHTTGAPVWQRNYYEHIIRDGNELDAIRRYILNNPIQWELDQENPLRIEAAR